MFLSYFKMFLTCVVLLVFSPGQDRRKIYSFHRNCVKQSKKKSLPENFLVVSQVVRVKNPQRAFNRPKAHSTGLQIERSILLKITSAFEE